MTYDPVKRTLAEQDFIGIRSGTTITYSATPDRKRALAEFVVPETPTTPIFRYYAFDLSVPPRPALLLPTPLSASDRARTVRMEINFRALPPPNTKGTATKSRGDALFRDDVYVRAADPDDPRDVKPYRPCRPRPAGVHMTQFRSMARDERGFSMFIVIVVMPGDVDVRRRRVRRGAEETSRVSGNSKDRKSSYASGLRRAELLQLTTSNQDKRLLDQVRRRPRPPNPTELNPVNQAWAGAGRRPAPAGATCPARPPSTRSSCCRPPVYTKSASSADQKTSWTWPRARSGCASPAGRRRRASLRRSVVSTFRRERVPGLPVLHRLRGQEPAGVLPAERPHRRPTNGAVRYRAARQPRASATTIQFADRRHASTARCTPTTTCCPVAARRSSGAVRPTRCTSPDAAPGCDRTRALAHRAPRSSSAPARRGSQEAHRSRRPTASCAWPPRPTASTAPATTSPSACTSANTMASEHGRRSPRSGVPYHGRALPANGVVYVDRAATAGEAARVPKQRLPLASRHRATPITTRAPRLRQPLRERHANSSLTIPPRRHHPRADA